ncbi:histidine phosphatase family protein [Sporolactobacillus pectinivorans]|uniref:histidine phosphatase family protein n=1 Tax=Sporolactobacillus pectinivorans TaxID=1591408 RepID=UPI0012FD5414|nr:histidine phosphatase family protein [Sporolactobacillus pectinivorans]
MMGMVGRNQRVCYKKSSFYQSLTPRINQSRLHHSLDQKSGDKMHVVFIRHGEPSYEHVTRKNFVGHGRDLAELSPKGIKQAEQVAKDDRLKSADLILSSPYTRTLQTAAIISKSTGLNIKVETDLHEWLPDLTYQNSGFEHFIELIKEVKHFNGSHNTNCKYQWESFSNVRNRAEEVLIKYVACMRIVVVTHKILISQFVTQDKIPYCGIFEIEI